MLLAASLMLREGLGESHAADTLSAALREARVSGSGPVTAVLGTLLASTRDFADVVVGLLPASHRNAEFVPSGVGSSERQERRGGFAGAGAGVRVNGADAILRSLEAEGVEVVFGIPGGAILPTYDAIARGTTVRHVLARHEQGAGHMAEGYARASGRVGVAIATSGPGATNLVTPIADAWMDSTPLVCITGQVRSHLIGTDAFQECDITGITMPIVKHSWLVQDVEEIPHVIKAAFHVARTGRCGPVLVDIPRDIQEAELDFRYPDEVDLPGWRPPRRIHPRQIREAARGSPGAEKPVLYVGGGDAERRRLRRAPRAGRGRPAAGRHDADGEGRVPGDARAALRLARHARAEVVELGDEQVRRPRRRRRALRRPRHRQALGVRARRDRDPPRHRRGRDRQAPARRHPRRRPAEADVLAELCDGSCASTGSGAAAPEPWLRQIEDWRDEFPLRYARTATC